MGRSSGYCFKIIACGGSSESVDRDDIDASSETKGSDKRGWSFRKRSIGHQVLSNTVITETLSENKTSLEPVIISSEEVAGYSVSEKTSANEWTEELPGVSASTTEGITVTNLMTKAADEDNIKFNSSADESSIIVIQAVVRKFLAQRELAMLKNVVKLQSAVRGHMVRCRAAGTLRCIQAIVKMQTLVRVKSSSIGKKGKQDSRSNPHPTYISIEKLLSNRFATQILESTPRTKQINIKCEPSKNDPAWKWMERWMSVSSPEAKNEIENMIKSTDLNSEIQNPPLRSELRKASNPTFFAAPSKTNLSKLAGSSNQKRNIEPVEPLVYESLRVVRTGGSECGTELSVTSMLDSPDPSEVGNIESDKVAKVMDNKAGEEHALLGTELTHSISILSEEYDGNAHIELEPETGRQMYKFNMQKVQVSSPEASPRSHVTVPESQGTPSSPLSNNKKTRVDRKLSGQKPSKSNSKKSSGLDRLYNPKPGNRRNSFGSQSSDQIDEARDSSSSNCIPSYMLVTESARAKALGNNSPRSSPDMLGKEAYAKKRHSLPGGVNGRHGSPRVKQSSPQGQQTIKERKWQN